MTGPAAAPQATTRLPGPAALATEYNRCAAHLAELDAELWYEGAGWPHRLRSAYQSVGISLERRLAILAAEYFYQTGQEITDEGGAGWTADLMLSA